MSGTTISGLTEIKQLLEQMNTRANRVVLDTQNESGRVIQNEVAKVFQSSPSTTSGGTVYGGKTWKSLSEAYLKQRPDRASGQIYIDTGALLRSLQVGGSGTVLVALPDSIEFGTDLVKAAPLQKAREFLFETEPMARELGALWSGYIVEGF
jgi:phosphatidylserine decarboxylase